jgi:hypothetical protein
VLIQPVDAPSVAGDDPEFASYPRIAEREFEAGGLN